MEASFCISNSESWMADQQTHIDHRGAIAFMLFFLSVLENAAASGMLEGVSISTNSVPVGIDATNQLNCASEANYLTTPAAKVAIWPSKAIGRQGPMMAPASIRGALTKDEKLT